MWLTFSNLTSPALYFQMCTLKGWTRCSIIFLPFRTCWDSKQLGNQVITFVSQPLQGSILYYLSLTLIQRERECVYACVCVLVFSVVSNSSDCSPPGSSLHGILQARILEWVAILFSRGSFRPRDQTWLSHVVGRRFTIWKRKSESKSHSVMSASLRPHGL